MGGNHPSGYLDELPPAQREQLSRVNEPGLTALREYLAEGTAVAFLGAGVSAPLYPLWDSLIGELVDAAAGRLSAGEAATCRALARRNPEEAVEIVRRALGAAVYREVLRETLRARADAESGRSWTAVQELVCRCSFKAVVTTNYDPGILDARIRVRPRASATGFTTWDDELGLDRWRTGDVFGESELPVLFAHGQHNRPDSVVLATTEYRRAYAGKLPHVLARLIDGHLVWLGFSFTDQRIAAILREVADRTGTEIEPGGAPRHVAVMAWDPAEASNDPGVLVRQAEIAYGARLVLYPAPGGGHSALARLLADLTDDRYPPAPDLPARPAPQPDPGTGEAAPGMAVTWVPGVESVLHFTGRSEELARLDRWAADSQVALIGVTAWGGAGKTSLVTRWTQQGGPARRPGIRGVFGWSFYADASAEHWATGLLKWARRDLGFMETGTGRIPTVVLGLLRAVPLVLVLDGLEVVQEGPAGGEFGRLLDGTLREVLTGACQFRHGGLILLTSRFPFADLESFDGGRARMLEVPPFTPAEGATLLAAAGGDWLDEGQRRSLVQAVDGHALATGVLAGLLADHPPTADLAALAAELSAAARTDARVGRVLRFYAARLAEEDRYLLAAISLFARPVTAGAVLAVAGHEVFGSRLAGWSEGAVQDAVRDRLGGLASWHPDGTISAHPLVRETFRPLVLDAAGTAAETSLAGLPAGTVGRADAVRVVEAIEMLLDAGQWQPANDVYKNRSGGGRAWLNLPAARLGQRASAAFVMTYARRDACAAHLGPSSLNYYVGFVGVLAMYAGDLTAAREYLLMDIDYRRQAGNTAYLASSLQSLVSCLAYLGMATTARDTAAEALASAQAADDQLEIRDAHAGMGWLAARAGHVAEAELQFTTADQLQVVIDPNGDHLYSGHGIRWAEWLATDRTVRACSDPDRPHRGISQENGWNEDVARCDRMLGRLALAAGDVSAGRGAPDRGRHRSSATETSSSSSPSPWLTSPCGRRSAGTWRPRSCTRPRPSRSAAPAAWSKPHSRRLAVRARVHAARASRAMSIRTRCSRDATLPTPPSGWRTVITWRGTNSTRCVCMPCSTGPRGSTGMGGTGGRPVRPAGSAGSGPPIRRPPWSGSLPRRRAGGPVVAVGAE